MENKAEKKKEADSKPQKRMVPRPELPDVEYLLTHGIPGKEGKSVESGGWSDIIIGPIGLFATFCLSLFIFHVAYMAPNANKLTPLALSRRAVKAKKMTNMPPSIVAEEVVSDETIEL
uniref:Uncharacterized protein n=1 Tax=Leptocylindrus danicus TaxID=163516 RepID=A0A7S2JZ53_9STRA|mmetsp:Transcript_14708/g.21714  ORF Transcript_14708/g.21714 Transcript_14708/m.21714 type:complete len:118 (+) Transcript_14708:107-460(+)|eukprot:CAMPEP_0116028516 /NCGR_PEP_ID=MMETSP0321-20121206/15465_1 /TAXON_ID=163516 /ORGANISM="Leptocylindrus danicus var. danicus, Strain B650" /LENGTH=117 /DNA_ID=CAMNT_0003502465 /DNA_START=94 /DNA_END=447 /DNA_ORIENTATION=-